MRGAREAPAPRDSLNFRRTSLLSRNEFESGTFTIVLHATSSFTYVSVIYGANFPFNDFRALKPSPRKLSLGVNDSLSFVLTSRLHVSRLSATMHKWWPSSSTGFSSAGDLRWRSTVLHLPRHESSRKWTHGAFVFSVRFGTGLILKVMSRSSLSYPFVDPPTHLFPLCRSPPPPNQLLPLCRSPHPSLTPLSIPPPISYPLVDPPTHLLPFVDPPPPPISYPFVDPPPISYPFVDPPPSLTPLSIPHPSLTPLSIPPPISYPFVDPPTHLLPLCRSPHPSLTPLSIPPPISPLTPLSTPPPPTHFLPLCRSPHPSPQWSICRSDRSINLAGLEWDFVRMACVSFVKHADMLSGECAVMWGRQMPDNSGTLWQPAILFRSTSGNIARSTTCSTLVKCRTR